MRILIFGGTGFLGKNLVSFLLKKHYDVGLYVRPLTIQQKFICKKKNLLDLKIGEFQRENDFESIVRGYDVVYHLISSTIPGIINPLQDIEMTIKPSLRLLEACVKEKVKRVVFFSSGGTVYGISKRLPIHEDDVGQPISAYGIQKQTLERYCRFYQYCYGLPITILRIANPYGRYQRPFSNQGLIANILGCYMTHTPIEIWGDGKVTRDYIYVDDVIDAAERVLHYHGPYDVFNIGSGNGKSINDIVNLVDQLTDFDLPVNRYPGRKVDVPSNILDITRACHELKWHPDISLEDGIKRMLSYWNEKNKTFEGR